MLSLVLWTLPLLLLLAVPTHGADLEAPAATRGQDVSARAALAPLTYPTHGADLSPPAPPPDEDVSGRARPSLEYFAKRAKEEGRTFCAVLPDPDGKDDAPAIMEAMNGRCRRHSIIFLPGPTYNMRTVMATLQLKDVFIWQYGRMLWSPDIEYWRNASVPVGFQNQSTVWSFGGDMVTWDGWNKGTLDGNGQVWYDWAKNRGNLAGRPMNVQLLTLTNSNVRRLRFVQSQMWTMAIMYSYRVTLEDIYINSTSHSQWNTLNTDGCDTIYSDQITFRRWNVTNGDDGIALKGNSTNIAIFDSAFHDGQGLAIGSVGQYKDRMEYIFDVYVANITMRNTAHVSYLKTWSGVSRGFPPNGGGGGHGHAFNIVMVNITVERLRQQPFFAWQCEHYSGFAGKDCNSSKFQIGEVSWHNIRGTVNDDVSHAGWFQCSAAAGGCDAMGAWNVNLTKVGGGVLDRYHCENVRMPGGFQCENEEAKKKKPDVASAASKAKPMALS